MHKSINILTLILLSVLITGCFSVHVKSDTNNPYSKINNWVIRENAVPRYFAKLDVIYLFPTMYSDASHPTLNWINSTYAEDIYNFSTIQTNDVFGKYARIFSPFVHQLEYGRMIEIVKAEGYKESGTELDRAISDVVMAIEYYFKHFHEKGHPFIILGQGQGAYELYVAMKRCSKIHPDNGFVAAYFMGLPHITAADILADFGGRGIKPAEGEYDTGVVCAWNAIDSDAPKSIFADKDTYVINPLNWRTDDVHADAKYNLGSMLYDRRAEKIIFRKLELDNFCGAVIDPNVGALRYDIPPSVEIPERHELFEAGFRNNIYGLFIKNVVANAYKRTQQYNFKRSWNERLKN